jgi:hypothetical protein
MAAVVDYTVSRTLTKEELAQTTGAGVDVIRKLTTEVFPAHLYVRGDDREYRYAPVCVALVELLQELHDKFGPRSHIPRAIVRQVIADLEGAWRAPETPRQIRVRFDGLDVRIHSLKFLDRARQNLAALAS